MTDYSDLVIDHAQKPRNFGNLENPDGSARVDSSCGDWVQMMLQLDAEQRITAVRYLCFGCASALATASLLSELALGMAATEALAITSDNLISRMGGIPDEKTHCNQMSLSAFQQAVQAALNRRQEPVNA